MDGCAVPPQQQDCAQHSNCVTLYQCGYPSSEGYSSLSPASSNDSCELSPAYMPCGRSQGSYGNTPVTQKTDMRNESTFLASQHKKRKGKLAYTQRQSASEREKMRMRNLSKALQNLRRYLPPSVAPADKNLTKIETLQLTIRYIAHLSNQLGLTEDILAQRRQVAIHRNNSCPIEPSCYIDNTHRLCTETQTESCSSTSATTGLCTEERAFPGESAFHHKEAPCRHSYELSYTSELETSHLQQSYPAGSTTLSYPQAQYYTTGHQQQHITSEEYTNLVLLWRKEQPNA